MARELYIGGQQREKSRIGLDEFGVRSSEFGIRSSEFGIRSSEFGVRSSEFGVQEYVFLASKFSGNVIKSMMIAILLVNNRC
jgi:hypothetical protein